MELVLEPTQTTLVDQVEDCLLTHFKNNNLKFGDHIPNESLLAEELGVARSVIREALSRLKMFGMIHSRPRKGMVLAEPTILGGMKRVIDPRFLSEESVFDLLEFRIALEIGISSDLFDKVTPEQIRELEEIVKLSEVLGNNEYSLNTETSFHTKLYEITGNRTIAEFQDIIHPVLTYIKDKFRKELTQINVRLKDEGRLASHADLLRSLREGDREGYRKAFCDFDAERVARMTDEDVERLMHTDGIVRNRLKIKAAITNARLFLLLQKEFGSFYDYTLSFFPDRKPIVNSFRSLSEIPVSSPESDAMSRDMKKRGFKFFGSTICYAHLQATGFVNDHLTGCICRKKSAAER